MRVLSPGLAMSRLAASMSDSSMTVAEQRVPVEGQDAPVQRCRRVEPDILDLEGG